MQPRTELYFFGVASLIFFASLIVIPYLKRKRDLLLPTNFFLGGAIFFISISAIDSSYVPRVLGYVSKFSRQDYLNFYFGVVSFFVGFAFAFLLGQKLGVQIAKRAFIRWPPITRQLLFFMFCISIFFSLGAIFRVDLIGVGQVFFQIAMKVSTIMIVLAFVAWFHDRQNPFWLMFLIVGLLFALFVAIMVGGGRRTLVGALFAIPICYYWVKLRYVSPQKVLAWMTVVGVVMFLFVGAYSSVRHLNRERGKDRDVGFSIQALRSIPRNFGKVPWGQMLGQRSVECSLLAGRVLKSPKDKSYLHSMKFVLVNPVPRAIWPDKPVGLGKTLPKLCGSPYRASWGPGIVGHGHYEGGLLALIFYGALVGLSLRILDNIVLSNSTNPFVLGIFASVCAHIFGWLRGDIGTFTIQIFAGIIAGVVLAVIGRMMFGTAAPAPQALPQGHVARP